MRSVCRPALRLALVYAAVAAAWILLSDRVVAALFSQVWPAMTVSLVKGWLFVVVTASLLYLERRNNEAARRSLDERLELALESAHVVHLEWTRATGLVMRAGRWPTVTAAELRRAWTTLDAFGAAIVAEDAEPAQAALRAAERSGEPLAVQMRMVLPDGGVAWIEVRGRFTYTASGRTQSFLGVAVEVTAREEAIRALRASEERLSAILHALPDIVFRVDRDGLVVDCHAPAQPVSLGEPESARGRPITACVPADLGPLIGAGLEDLFAGREPPLVRYDLGLPSGRHALDVWFSLCGADEALVLLRDVSAHARAEENLRQAAKMEAVGRLAGGVAHDFNNLLCTIQGYAEILLAGLGEEDKRAADVREILRSTARATNLTQQLLDYSRPQPLVLRNVDLAVVVRDMEAMLKRMVGEDIVLHLDLPDGPVPVHADAGQLQQVLMNLVANARDAMPTGGAIHVRVGEDGSREDQVGLSVSDTGSGMDDATMARIFEPFFTTKELGRGTGLGLATAQTIVETSGGRMTVRSTLGAGSTFCVRLPRADSIDDEESAPADGAAGTGSERILVVEDEDSVRHLTTRVLRAAGYHVRALGCSEEAAALSDADLAGIDMLLTDIVMPNLSGGELADHLTSRRPDLPVLFMTGYGADEILRHGVRESGVALLPKPFTSAQLLGAVRRAIESGQPAA
jgi:signal transduction histidine kinase/ActR/RegA family two-component response regulator